MKQAICLVALIGALLMMCNAVLGYEPTYQIAYGALTLMAAMISLTFLWLWSRRATPRARGMSLSWAGTTSVLGWWWVFNLMGDPAPMVDSGALFLFLSLYFAGAILHFAVIQRSFGVKTHLFPVPVIAAIVFSLGLRLMF